MNDTSMSDIKGKSNHESGESPLGDAPIVDTEKTEQVSVNHADTPPAEEQSDSSTVKITTANAGKNSVTPRREKRSRASSRSRNRKEKKEFEERLLEVRRVTRVTTGGRQLAFRAVMILGNKKGRVGIGIGKAGDVLSAIQKATRDAKKHMVDVPVTETQSVPYAITHKYKAARIKLLPAGPGTGLKAGSSVRSVLELAGYNNILSKIVGTNNKLANAIATVHALQSFKVS